MAVGIPLPELDVTKPQPAPFPDALQEFQRAAQLKTAAAQQQQIQAQTQGVQQQNEMQAMQLKDEQMRRQLAPQFVTKDDNGKITGFDTEGLYSKMLENGADPLNINAMRMKQIEMQKALLGLNDEQKKNAEGHQAAITDTLQSIQKVYDQESKEMAKPGTPLTPATAPQAAQQPQQQPFTPGGIAGIPPWIQAPGQAAPEVGEAKPGTPESLARPPEGAAPTQSEGALQESAANAPRPIGPRTQKAYFQGLQNLQRQGVDVSRFQPVLHDASDLEDAEAQLGSFKEVQSLAEQQAKTAESSGKGAQAQAAAAKDEWIGNDGIFTNIKTGQVIHSGGSPSLQAFQEYIAKGGNPLNFASDQAAREASNPALQAAKLHLSVAEDAAKQAIADGDPRKAAQLLVSGVVAPSQIVSSRKPAFAQEAFTAAQELQPGWSAPRADADFKVASSPANVAFFGSAKSLTDKGGTLDQLKDAGKDIPENQIPVFNTVADAIKASTGSGPIAKYAAIALGVADDYAKVMGGGQGSDTSRTQALNVISAKQSPEQRAASIEGIRGAVGSQTKSRIGNNQVLKKMYGESTEESANPFTEFGGKPR